MPTRAHAAIGIAVGFALVACTASFPTRSSLITRSTPPSASDAPTELVRSGDPLTPGTYTRSTFAPAITFEIDGGEWFATQLLDGFFDIQHDVGSPDVITIQFARPEAVYGPHTTPVEADAAQAAARALARNPDLTVLGRSESRIGGLTGFNVTVENTSGNHVTVMDVPPGPLGIDPDRALWVSLFDTPEGVLAIMVGGSVAHWDDALTAAEPVLESVRIGS